jgi:hypothetical protein
MLGKILRFSSFQERFPYFDLFQHDGVGSPGPGINLWFHVYATRVVSLNFI